MTRHNSKRRPNTPLTFSLGAAAAVVGRELPKPGHWTEFALCAEVGPDAFFPDDGAPAWLAKQVCAGCEFWVRAECLGHALRRPEWGIWGGTDEQERDALRSATPAEIHAALLRVGLKTCEQCGEDKPFGAYEIRWDTDGCEYLRKTCRSCRRESRNRTRELETAA